MKNQPDSVKIFYRDQLFKLRPAPDTYEELVENAREFFQKAPEMLIFNYQDQFGDKLSICNTKSLNSFYLDFAQAPNLFINLENDFDEILDSISVVSPMRSSEEDVINLVLLGIISPTKDLLNVVKLIQSAFARKIIDEVLKMVRTETLEDVANLFAVPWEVVIYMTRAHKLATKQVSKKINYIKLRNLLRPERCLIIVQQYIQGDLEKDDILKKFEIDNSVFKIWLDLFSNQEVKQLIPSIISDKDKLKLLSCYLLGKVSLAELESGFNVSQQAIESWAFHFSQQRALYNRERIVTAEEKRNVVNKYLNGEFSQSQFQNKYAMRANCLYKWVKQVQSGRPLSDSTFFRTSSEELEQAYSILLSSYSVKSK